MTTTIEDPVHFELRLPSLSAELGGSVDPLIVRGWLWSSDGRADVDGPGIELVDPAPGRIVVRSADADRGRPMSEPPTVGDARPTILVVHALTGDAQAGGPEGWWSPLIGPGRPFDPTTHRVLGFNNLGSCYGTSGPADAGFSVRSITTWDQARTLLRALDALGIPKVALVTGGSLGGMITLALAALAPERVERIAPIAACAAASAWIIGFNHVQRRAIATAASPAEGLSLARQIAMLTYRAEIGLDDRQGRRRADPGFDAFFRMQSYLDHQGRKLVDRFSTAAYLAMMDAMDHHDLSRVPPRLDAADRWQWLEEERSGLDRIAASCLSIGIDTDQLFFPVHAHAIAESLAARPAGRAVARSATLHSRHGHDGFLIEWDQLDRLLRAALAMPSRTES